LNSHSVLAFDNGTTHPALTSEIVDFYNSLHSEHQITSEQKDWIILGSKEEDTPPRWLNHFYDPVRQTGWTGLKAGTFSPDAFYRAAVAGNAGYAPVSAVDWLNNNSLQENLSLYGGNHTWRKGLDDYAAGNAKEAYITLGHALHLLEDMAVPEHTRDDTHAPIAGVGDDGSPFEDYLRKWNPGNIKELNIIPNIKAENLTPPIKSSVADYLAALAEYSNKYFFSKDTINDERYQLPKIIREDDKFGYGLDENNLEIPLVLVKKITNNKNDVLSIFSIKNQEIYYPILETYFTHLSKQTVLYGAGVIDLFNKQANDAIENKEFSTRVVRYDFSFLPIKAVSIIGEGAKIMTATQSFFGSIFDGAQKAVNFIVAPFKNTVSSPPEIIQNKQSVISSEAVQTSPLQMNLNSSAIGPPQEEENLVQIETVQSIEPFRKEEISEAELLAIQSQLDDITDQIDDLTFLVAVLTKSSGDNKTVRSESNASVESESNQEVQSNQGIANQNQVVVLNYSGGGVSGEVSANKVYPKIIINEIQLASASSMHDEFVELYNPNNNSVDLTDWYLQKKTASGSNFSTFATKSSFSSKNISAYGYLLIAHPSSTFSADIFTDYGIADNNTLTLKNPNGEIVDKVGWGNANDYEGGPALSPAANQSIQRKNSGGVFTDADDNVNDFEIQICPSPNLSAQTCATGNIGESAGSSTTGAVATSSGGILISEIMVSGLDSGDEFIELYNPTTSTVDISGWSIQYVGGSATEISSSTASKKNFLATSTVGANRFFLIARDVDGGGSDGYVGTTAPDMNHRTFSLSGASSGAKIFLVSNQEYIDGLSDPDIADYLDYAFAVPAAGGSLERKAESGAACVSAEGAGEFLGNSCDTDNDSDFEIRTVSKPQNSASLPEPRSEPTVSNFASSFSTSTMELSLTWDFTEDANGATTTVLYQINDEISTSTLVFYGTSTNRFAETIEASSTGRDYVFSIVASDEDGLVGLSATTTIFVPLVSASTSAATSTSADSQVLVEDATTTWRASTDMCCGLPFWGYKTLSPATTTYTTLTAENYFVTGIYITNNTDNSNNNRSGYGYLRAAIMDPTSGLIMASSTNFCYGEGLCVGFSFVFENSPLIPATFWLQFYVDDGLQGYADWSVSDIKIYGLIGG